jgi:hypothetical protein
LEVEAVLTDVAADEHRPAGRRVLCGFEDHRPFVYARGDDYFRFADNTLWAHQVDGELVSVRSGEPLVYQHGNIFYDILTRQPLYYESAKPDQHDRSTSGAHRHETMQEEGRR